VQPSVAEAVRAFVRYRPEEHQPDQGRRQLYDDAYRRYRDVYFALKPVFDG
jgi:sugar (pentulose or hexulose) kinase